MQCRVCGAENEAGAAFCFRCGSALAGQSATGPTVNLGQAGAPTPGTADLSAADITGARGSDAGPADDSGARVYDAPPADPRAPELREIQQPPTFNPPTYQVPPQTGGAYNAPYNTQTLPQQSNAALWSMLLGVGSLILFALLLCTLFLSPLSAAMGIPALLLGRNARREIQAAGGQLSGEGLATAGIVMGWINIGLSALTLCAIIGFFVLVAVGVTTSP